MAEALKKHIIIKKQGCFVSAVLESDRLIQIDIEKDSESILSANKKTQLEKAAKVRDIFIGKVKDIVPNIQAAFIEIGNKQNCYLSLEKLKQPIFLNPKKNQEVHQGDEILVQVSREAVKTKPADVTADINITGRYAVLTHGKTGIGISGKIQKDPRYCFQPLSYPLPRDAPFRIEARGRAHPPVFPPT